MVRSPVKQATRSLLIGPTGVVVNCKLRRQTEKVVIPMADEDDGLMWPPMFKGMQQASESAMEQQQELMKQLFASGGMPSFDMNQLGAMSQMATFKTRVQSGGRISIPDAEREALDIEEGDIVQTVVIPVKRSRSD